MTPISNPEIDCSGQIASIMINQASDELFPNKHYCSLLNVDFLKRRHIEDRKALISKIGDEVAFRNGYSKNNHLSMLNSKKQKSLRYIANSQEHQHTCRLILKVVDLKCSIKMGSI